MPDFGPFSVDPRHVTALGGVNFGQFVTRLLATEAAAHGMAGTTLETTYLENVGDGGVDAGLRHAYDTAWVPAGESAWQFKAGDLPPSKCKTELEGAEEAVRTLRRGGSYRLVLGATLPQKKSLARRAKLIEAATGLGIADVETKIEVITADGLARWTEEFPALAVNPLLRGPGVIGQTFGEWSSSNRHLTTWASSPGRQVQIDALRGVVTSNQLDVHLDGVSGLGKTRLVLEALRAQPYEPIVVYVLAADHFPVTALLQLQAQNRTAIVVIDECTRKQHEVYAAALTVGSCIRLVTIGEPGGNSTRTPMIRLNAFEDYSMKELLRANRPNLPPEAERVVVQVAAGNIDYGLKLAQVLIDRGPGSIGTLVTDEDLRAFFATQFPEGQLFLASCALSLFSRFGVDGEVASELGTIANGLGLQADDLDAALWDLQQRGFLSKQGRYRSVGPHPVALFLAAEGWTRLGEKIVTSLLPRLAPDFAERLFERATDIGELGDGSPALSALLAEDGPLASFETLAESENSGLLAHFAVLAPSAVVDRLADLVAIASEEQLRQHVRIRRDLVWALEKLAWHTSTFKVAADALLRLAVAENESYSNNASGTWTNLFGTALPGTAASPSARITYLEIIAGSEDARARLMAARAANRALQTHESIMASGEIQGGVVVEPRGRPATYGDAWAYRNGAMDVLGKLTTDSDEAVSQEARKHLIGSLHGLLEIEANRNHLAHVIAALPDEVVELARLQVQELHTLLSHVEVQDDRPLRLAEFEKLLPEQTAVDRLRVLASTRSWARSTNDVGVELAQAARSADATNPHEALLRLFDAGSEVAAAYAIGYALRSMGMGFEAGVYRLSPLAGTPNGEALVGFLQHCVSDGDTEAFDRYIDEANLEPALALHLTVRGPRTAGAVQRVDRLLPQVTVTEATRVLFAWMREANEADSAHVLTDLDSRIASQGDYNAVIDFAAMQVFEKEEALPALDSIVAELVARRMEFPAVGQESWDWSVLARRRMNADPLSLVRLIADLIEGDSVSAFAGSQEGQLLQESVQAAGEDAWVELMTRLLRGEWRLSFSTQEWLGNLPPVEVAKQWVGNSVERARVLANVTKPGGLQLAPVARFLIDEFHADGRVLSSLVGQFVSGTWTGDTSKRIANQLEEVRSWISEPGQSAAVKAWGRHLIADLEADRRKELQREEERGW